VSVAELARRLRATELSPREAVEHYLARIDELDPAINACIAVRAEEALAEADALGRAGEPRGPLWGVPVGVKDVVDVAGMPTTANSHVLDDAQPATADATAVARLREAGAILLAKLNTHEFAYGALTTSPRFGAAHNPWSLDRVCGGSSGGSGAAAAADLVAGTLGTDTAGSIRIPACFNGVTGLRPTWGRVSNRGVVPVAWGFDTVGPVARSAEDCALLLEAIAGRDPGDPTTVDAPVPRYGLELKGGAGGLRIGVVRSLFEHELLDPRIGAALEAALEELRGSGASLVDVGVEHLEHFGTIQQCMQFPEAAEVHREWLRTRLLAYGDDVRARLLVGLYLPTTTYVLGQRARRAACAAFEAVMADVDLLVAPTMPVLPPRIGDETVQSGGGEPVLYRLTVIPYNSPWSLVGAPVVSVPAGFVDGLPVGLALVGPRFGEATVLRAAHAFQRLTDWHDRRPEIQPVEVRS
jgi:aspartyl-tRNA(Asn)/glutamyl-tRNA(Gln) amidotransferase subunit A